MLTVLLTVLLAVLLLLLRKRADTVQAGQHEAYLRYMVFTLESACRAMQQGQAKWVWIMDIAGGGRGRARGLAAKTAQPGGGRALRLRRRAARAAGGRGGAH